MFIGEGLPSRGYRNVSEKVWADSLMIRKPGKIRCDLFYSVCVCVCVCVLCCVYIVFVKNAKRQDRVYEVSPSIRRYGDGNKKIITWVY